MDLAARWPVAGVRLPRGAWLTAVVVCVGTLTFLGCVDCPVIATRDHDHREMATDFRAS
jgi:hypothetical protein